jgi:hypothetical protein
MTIVLSLLAAMMALGGGDIDAVTPGPGGTPTPGGSSGVARVTVVAERPSLMLGNDESVGLTVDVSGFAPGAALTLRGLSNVGRVEALTPAPAPTSPGRFTTRYLTPKERFPQVAVIVIEATAGDRRARGVIRLPMLAPTEMPFRTDPFAQVTLRVGERTFGPTAADSTGRVKLPIIVPPGVGFGQARAVDRDGNLNETVVDLQPAAYPRAVIVAPPQLEVGTLTEIFVYATEPRGDPTPAKNIDLRPSKGVVHADSAGTGSDARFLFEAPSTVDAITFEAIKLGDPAGSFQLVTPLRAAPAKKMTLTSSTSWLVIGSGQTAQIAIAAEDRFGNPAPCNQALLTAGGVKLPVEVTPTGVVKAIVRAPEHYVGKDVVTVEAALGTARTTTDILLSGGPPARLTVDLAAPAVVGDGRHGVEVRVNAVDTHGAPTMISGISWEISGGRLSNVRKPRVGSYVAEFVPRRASEAHTETVAVMASQTLRASTTLWVEPPRPRAVVTVRAAFFSNLGSASGPAAFLDAVQPLRGRFAPVSVGLSVGYLHDDLTTQPLSTADPQGARIEINQFPIMAIARYRLSLRAAELSLRAGVGVSLARTRLTPPPQEGGTPVSAGAQAVALEGGGEAAFPLSPGQLIIGLRYLHVEFGRTSRRDEIRGNSAGLVADLGYRLSF